MFHLDIFSREVSGLYAGGKGDGCHYASIKPKWFKEGQMNTFENKE